ncbi:neurogenic differentiation factor 6-like [Homarus americanus]|uniref:Helix-loop-helix protein delilah-like 3 n=1 Tax=Homarus americanus TaxID=6706 RepID=A0A8J5MMW2_HOMAM|nr:neurogenic differentiation factor 6-like [Homarus americanus]KAG7157264.1 Helix-loop-helix protein delilah-like 3 [Homarus americanus]
MIDKEDLDMEELLPRSTQNDKMSCTDNNNNCGQRRPTRIAEKYGLRPRTIIRRLQLERSRDDLPRRQSKTPKHRPPPLSKYRRKTANARERHRMKEINDAFETLRRVLPDFCSRQAAAAMTKITTLKLAVNYIRALSHILEDGHPGDINFFDGLQFADISMGSPLTPTTSDAFTTHYSTHHVVHTQSPHNSTSPVVSSTTSSPALPRGSLGSTSDLSDLLSDDSCVFEDNLDAFDDIPALPEADPFALLLVPDTEPLALGS